VPAIGDQGAQEVEDLALSNGLDSLLGLELGEDQAAITQPDERQVGPAGLGSERVSAGEKTRPSSGGGSIP